MRKSIDGKFKNSIKVSLIAGTNLAFRRKALKLLQYKNFEVSDPIVKEIARYAIEDIELAIERSKAGYEEQLQYFDATKTCINIYRNQIGKFIS